MTFKEMEHEARHAAASRGHRIRCQSRTHDRVSGRRTSFWTCRCGATVTCDTNPPPNGITIGGDAVAVNCKKGKADAEA